MDNFKKVLDIIQILIILGLIIALFSVKACCDKKIKSLSIPLEIKTTTEIKYDTIRHNIISYTPRLDTLYIKDTIFYPQIIDSLLLTEISGCDSSLLKLYFNLFESYNTTKIYIDNIESDSLKITITDTVYRNSIINRSLKYDILFKTKTIRESIILKEKGMYIGVGGGFNRNGVNNVGVELLYKTKENTMYGLGVHVDQQFNPLILGKVLWKLTL
jgi:hypothetical protein